MTPFKPVLVLALCASAVAAAAAHADDPKPATAKAALVSNTGSSAGEAQLTAAPGGVLLRIEATGLAPGWHGIHFHAKGDCSKSDFTSAGGHVHVHDPANPTVIHGLLSPGANDSGDLPNIFADASGAAHAEIFSSLVSLTKGADGRASLLDEDGAAIVIHANADDHRSQPIGGAGPRVACGVIKPH